MSGRGLILLAGGRGTRMGSSLPKQFIDLRGKPIVHYSLELFEKCGLFNEIVIVCSKLYRCYFPSFTGRFADPGPRRQDSTASGEKELSKHIDSIVIHDAARPFIQLKDLEALIQAGEKIGVASLGHPVKWTVKESDASGVVIRTLNREQIWEIQTPQYLKREIAKLGIAASQERKECVTDDVSLAELIGHPVKLVKGSDKNLKITTPFDLKLAEEIVSNG